MEDLLADLRHEFHRHKDLADRALATLDDLEFVRRPVGHVNSVAIIVKHLAGNLASRWTDFLTADGEEAGRDRDSEFLLTEQDTRANLLTAWERGWKALFDALKILTGSDLTRTVMIRGERHSVPQALLRGLSHAAYHTGQILYLARVWRPDSPWLTIPPHASRNARSAYLGAR